MRVMKKANVVGGLVACGPYKDFGNWIKRFEEYRPPGKGEFSWLDRALLDWESSAWFFVEDIKNKEPSGSFPNVGGDFGDLSELLIHWCQVQEEVRLEPKPIRDFVLAVNRLHEKSSLDRCSIELLEDRLHEAVMVIGEIRTANQRLSCLATQQKVRGLRPCDATAYGQYLLAAKFNGDLDDSEAYKWCEGTQRIKEKLPKEQTWIRYVGRARRYNGKQKNRRGHFSPSSYLAPIGDH
jgi:hypothetical protein